MKSKSSFFFQGTAFNFLAIGLLLYLVYYLGAMGQIRGPFPYDPEEDE